MGGPVRRRKRRAADKKPYEKTSYTTTKKVADAAAKHVAQVNFKTFLVENLNLFTFGEGGFTTEYMNANGEYMNANTNGEYMNANGEYMDADGWLMNANGEYVNADDLASSQFAAAHFNYDEPPIQTEDVYEDDFESEDEEEIPEDDDMPE